MASERSQPLRTMHPFFQHLRRRFHKIAFHADAADPRPLLLPAKNPVHQMPEFMEERDHIAIFHQSRIIGGWIWKIAEQDRLRQLFSANAVQHRGPLGMAVFSWTRIDVQIKKSLGFSMVQYVPGFD